MLKIILESSATFYTILLFIRVLQMIDYDQKSRRSTSKHKVMYDYKAQRKKMYLSILYFHVEVMLTSMLLSMLRNSDEHV